MKRSNRGSWMSAWGLDWLSAWDRISEDMLRLWTRWPYLSLQLLVQAGVREAGHPITPWSSWSRTAPGWGMALNLRPCARLDALCVSFQWHWRYCRLHSSILWLFHLVNQNEVVIDAPSIHTGCRKSRRRDTNRSLKSQLIMAAQRNTCA